MTGRELKLTAAGIAGSTLIRALMSTVRYRARNMELVDKFHAEGKRVIFAFWHGRMLIPAHYYRNKPVKILISRHADGEYIARIITRLGFGTIRGSTSRGAVAALRTMREEAQSGRWDLAITPDGPRGPRFVFQPGAVYVARETGMPILPAGLGFSEAWELGSWDGFKIPRPFAQGRILVGDPVTVPPDAGPEEVERCRRGLEEVMRALTREADGGA
jgi:lysophospholipid acyltransferase (LPLAT)-like uncharacterized protein